MRRPSYWRESNLLEQRGGAQCGTRHTSEDGMGIDRPTFSRIAMSGKLKHRLALRLIAPIGDSPVFKSLRHKK